MGTISCSGLNPFSCLSEEKARMIISRVKISFYMVLPRRFEMLQKKLTLQLDMFEEHTWESPNDGIQYRRIIEKKRVLKFLMGLNKDLDEVRGRILGTKPQTSLREAFSKVRREESRKMVMLGTPNNQPTTEGIALAIRGPQPSNPNSRIKKGRPWCDHCRKPGHTREACWKLHGKPADWKPSRLSHESRGNATSSTNENGTSEPVLFNKEQLELLQKMISQSISSSTVAAGSLAQKGNFSKALNVYRERNNIWIIDSGASDHMTGDKTQLIEFKPCKENHLVKIADGSISKVEGYGSVTISETDSDSGKMIGSAEVYSGLYLLKGDHPLEEQAHKAVSLSQFHKSCFSANKDSEIMLLLYRLGHPNFFYLEKLFPSLFRNKRGMNLQCEVCQFSKHIRNSYPSRPYKVTHPFSMIHSDIWGPSNIKNITGARCQGIIHQSSCVDTHEQNGIAERKNRHLLEVARSLIFTTHVPKHFWGEAVLTAAYFINRMSSRVLKFQTPSQVLLKTYPENVTFFAEQPYYTKTNVQRESTSKEHQFWNIIENQQPSPAESPSQVPSIVDESPNLVIESPESPVKTLPQNPPDPSAKNSELCIYSKGNWHQKETAQRALPEQLHESEPTPRSCETSQDNSHSDSSPHESPDSRPIALRKGVRSCTNHPIYTYLSYRRLSPEYSVFVSSLNKIQVPNNIHEALEIPHWKAAIMEEVRALEKNNTWEIVDLPRGKRPVGCKWIFTVKHEADGSVERFKARLVAKGFTESLWY
ncbi:uncharacterized protein LOC111377743 [Olea europaea var. sylvestris]|uniref:uncharacterized protein LOC111377743 n=1 Tax=Olea europaea var. sylvestris TaxID=158386 RepID=UPI000C1D8446|nr:uncharacterized protein LOC111377743 [Olea europaea var. sylvestris]